MHPSWVAPLSQSFVTTISRAAWHRSLALKYEAAWPYSLALKGTPGLLYHYSYGTRNACQHYTMKPLAYATRRIVLTRTQLEMFYQQPQESFHTWHLYTLVQLAESQIHDNLRHDTMMRFIVRDSRSHLNGSAAAYCPEKQNN